MIKTRLYRILGWALLVYAAIGYFASFVYKFFNHKITVFFPVVSVLIISLGLNVFLWSGLILLWRADRNEYPDKKSKWVIMILIYGVIASVATGLLMSEVVIPTIIRR